MNWIRVAFESAQNVHQLNRVVNYIHSVRDEESQVLGLGFFSRSN